MQWKQSGIGDKSTWKKAVGFSESKYLIGKKFDGKKWRNFRQVTKIFTDENFCRRKFSPMNYFYRRIFFAEEKFKIVLICNNFSCRSKVLGSLRPKSDLLRIYSVWDPNLFKEITKKEGIYWKGKLYKEVQLKKCSHVEY